LKIKLSQADRFDKQHNFLEVIMNNQLKRLSLVLAGAALATLAGCGGGGGSGAAPPANTTSLTTKVIDGVVRNALVCVDKNLNGACDAGETSGRTDASGNVTLAVPNGDVGLYPIVAMVDANSEDMDRPGQPIGEPFTMTAPAGAAAVVSPYSTMIASAMTTGASLAEASANVQAQLNLNVDPLTDYTTATARAAALAAGGADPATVARAIVVTTQAQITAVASTLGTPASNSATITQADLTRLVQQRILQLLPTVLAAVSTNVGLTGAALEAAVVAAVAPSLATPAQAAVAVAINQQQALDAATPVAAYVPTASISIDALNYTDANNWSSRVFSGSMAQATLDTNGNVRVSDRRNRANAGVVANWNFGNNPQDQSILHWTGSAWEPCGLNFEFTATVRDANGNNSSNYCNNYSTTASSRTGFDISGQAMAAVYDQIRTGGFTNITIANSATALGTQTFPADSKLFYLTNTRLTTSPAYSPGSNALVFNYSPAVSAGGDARLQAAGTGCNAVEFQSGPAIATTSLENMVAAFGGNPCLFNQSSFVSGPTTFYDGGTQNSNYTSRINGNSTLSIGTVGTVNIASTPTAFFTGNQLIRLAFTGTGTNPVTYYTCSQRFINGSPRNCTVIGTGSWAITTLSDGSRMMSFTNPPATALTTNRVFVERNGKVYFGFQDKLTVTNSARFNTQASAALLATLGMPAVDPEVPLALTAASYQGTWDFRPAGSLFAFNVGTRVVISGTNTVTCFDNSTGNTTTCTGSITNPLTGAFTGTTGNGGTNSGNYSFIGGTATGTFDDPNSNPPASGALVGARR
jgi:trimeric autotransporter adhesin